MKRDTYLSSFTFMVSLIYQPYYDTFLIPQKIKSQVKHY